MYKTSYKWSLKQCTLRFWLEIVELLLYLLLLLLLRESYAQTQFSSSHHASSPRGIEGNAADAATSEQQIFVVFVIWLLIMHRSLVEQSLVLQFRRARGSVRWFRVDQLHGSVGFCHRHDTKGHAAASVGRSWL